MRKCLLLVSFLLTFSALNAQDWDVSNIKDLHKWSFRMTRGGDSLGYSIWEIRKMGDQFALIEDSSVPGFKEDMFFYVNSTSLAPDSVLISGRLSGFPIEAKARWKGKTVDGYSNMPKHPSRPTVSLNKELTADTKSRFMSFILCPFYKGLKLGSSFSYPQFNTMDGQVRTIEAKVTSEVTIQVLGETVKALKLELSGGVAEQNVYIDPVNHRIVKIDFRNIDWVYEMIASQ